MSSVEVFQSSKQDEVMDQVRRYGFADRTCAECKYGAVDNEGLCVIDATHEAVRRVA